MWFLHNPFILECESFPHMACFFYFYFYFLNTIPLFPCVILYMFYKVYLIYVIFTHDSFILM